MEMQDINILMARKTGIQQRLQEISGVYVPPRDPPQSRHVDYHWDILLKEMVRNDYYRNIILI